MIWHHSSRWHQDKRLCPRRASLSFPLISVGGWQGLAPLQPPCRPSAPHQTASSHPDARLCQTSFQLYSLLPFLNNSSVSLQPFGLTSHCHFSQIVTSVFPYHLSTLLSSPSFTCIRSISVLPTYFLQLLCAPLFLSCFIFFSITNLSTPPTVFPCLPFPLLISLPA